MYKLISLFYRLLFYCSILLPLGLYAQDPSYSNFDLNHLYYNPAYSGYDNGILLNATYRSLWPNVPGKFVPAGPFSTYHFWLDASLGIKENSNIGLGAFALRDAEGQGNLTTTSAGINIAFRKQLKLNRTKSKFLNLSAGLKAYYNDIAIDWDNLVYTDQLNIDYGINNSSSFNHHGTGHRNYMDFDMGILLEYEDRYTDNWHLEAGFATAHILSPSISLLQSQESSRLLPRKYVANLRGYFKMPTEVFFLGATILFEKQNDFYELNTGVDLYIRKKSSSGLKPIIISVMNRTTFSNYAPSTHAIIVGLQYRKLLVGHRSNEILYGGFAVDLPYKGLGLQTWGAYELTIGIILHPKGSGEGDCPKGTFDHSITIKRNVLARHSN